MVKSQCEEVCEPRVSRDPPVIVGTREALIFKCILQKRKPRAGAGNIYCARDSVNEALAAHSLQPLWGSSCNDPACFSGEGDGLFLAGLPGC